MASKSGKLLALINYREWRLLLRLPGQPQTPRGARSPCHRPLTPCRALMAAGMRVTVVDGRQIVGR